MTLHDHPTRLHPTRLHPARLRGRSRRGGFSFVETMLAVFLVACLAGVVSASMPVATLSRTKAENSDKAIALAQKEMEAIRGVGYSNLTAAILLDDGLVDSAALDASGRLAFTKVDSDLNDSPAAVLTSGTGTVLIEQVDTELRRVTVTVNWNERTRARSYAISTLVANL